MDNLPLESNGIVQMRLLMMELLDGISKCKKLYERVRIAMTIEYSILKACTQGGYRGKVQKNSSTLQKQTSKIMKLTSETVEL